MRGRTNSLRKMLDFNIHVNSLIGLAFFPNHFSQLILTKGGCERYGLQWDGGRVMSCNPELQYKMAIASMVIDDQSHPQHCLEKYLPLAKFQIKTVFTKKPDDFVGCRVELLGLYYKLQFRMLSEC